MLLALAVVTVDYGYEPDGKGGVEYIVQVTPEEFEHAKQAGEISSTVDASVRGRVSRFVLRVGNDPLPRDPGPEPPSVAQAQAFQSPAQRDQDHVPIPAIQDDPPSATPIPALAGGSAESVTRAKPQEAAPMSLPGELAETAQDALQRSRQAAEQQLRADAQNAVDAAAQQAQQLARQATESLQSQPQGQNPFRRLQAGDSAAEPPVRTASTAANSPATGPQFPSTNPMPSNASAPAAQSAAGPQTAQAGPGRSAGAPSEATASNLQLPSTVDNGRDDRWDRERTTVAAGGSSTASASGASTPTPNASSSALGNFGAPPPGLADPRLPASALSQQSSPQQSSPQQPAPRPQTAASAGTTAGPATSTPYRYGDNPDRYGNNTATADQGGNATTPQHAYAGQTQAGQSQGGQYQPGQAQPGQPQPGQLQPGQPQPGQYPAGQYRPGQYQTPVAGQNNAAGAYDPRTQSPVGNPAPAGGYANQNYGSAPYNASPQNPAGYAPGSAPGARYSPPANHPVGNAPPHPQLASNRTTGAGGRTGLLPGETTATQSPSDLDLDAATMPPSRPAGDDERGALPQQAFNLLLLLSLIANAYLIIHMTKLIQRYRDLRVNLRTATAGKAKQTTAATA
ncbi:hypothetical protein [Roseimaritima sediminicola]|uniref:hypothetical protein n=1 Tax=Roseimaritima sediminicola TaxID=2662066 RepID=UPI0012983FD4|nr:hypothetical protein [Roseimaritima sediminicola]